MGVDNARVEVEEGAELPVLDGSAEGWTRGVRDAGVVTALDPSGAQLPRSVPKPPNTVLVSEGDSFIVFNPEVSVTIEYAARAALRLASATFIKARKTACGKKRGVQRLCASSCSGEMQINGNSWLRS